MPLFGDTGESLIQPLVKESKAAMIQPHEVEDRGMKIGNMMAILHRLETYFIGGSEGLAPFHASSRKPHAEAVPVVVPAKFADSFAGRGSPKFATP